METILIVATVFFAIMYIVNMFRISYHKSEAEKFTTFNRQEVERNAKLEKQIKELKEENKQLHDLSDGLAKLVNFNTEVSRKYIEILSKNLDAKVGRTGHSRAILDKLKKYKGKEYFGDFTVDYDGAQEKLIDASPEKVNSKLKSSFSKSRSVSSGNSRRNSGDDGGFFGAIQNIAASVIDSIDSSSGSSHSHSSSRNDDSWSYPSSSSSSDSSSSSSYDSGSSSSSYDSGSSGGGGFD